ncbi:hypothetical protein NHX12_029481, partial [Muraenolepis orangiensis]
MAPQLVFTALALACLGVASEPDCNELVKPLANLRSMILPFHETCPDCVMWSDIKAFDSKEVRRLFLFTKTREMTLPNLERFKQQAACFNFTLGLHMGSYTDLCPEEKEERPFLDVECLLPPTGLEGVNIQNETLVYDGQFHETCPDCVMWSDIKAFDSKEVRRLFLFTKTREMTLPNLERFKQQAACFNFTLGLHMGSYT